MSHATDSRNFLRVPGFDAMQNPKRPRRPTWIKSFVRDLDDPVHLGLSLTVRGFLSDFEKLAASMMNRVPDDILFIARKINTPPAVAGKALKTCIAHGLISRFAEDLDTYRNNDLYQKTDARPIPPSNTNFQGSSFDDPLSDQQARSAINGANKYWEKIDDLDIPF